MRSNLLVKLIAVATLAFCSTGCGTAFLYSGIPDPCVPVQYVYGGTAVAWYLVTQPDAPDFNDGDWLRPFGAIDLPLSLAMDTVMLPVAVPLQIRESKKDRSDCDAQDNPEAE